MQPDDPGHDRTAWMAEDETTSADQGRLPAEPEADPARHGSADAIERLLQDGGLEPGLEAADELADDRAAWDRGMAVLEARDDVPGMAAWTAAMRSHFPDDPRLAAANAWTTTHTDGAEAGLPLWQAAMMQFPDEAEMRRGLAVALGLLGRRDEPEAVLQAGVRGDFTTAIARYEQGRVAFPESLPFYLGVADMLSRLGQHQEGYVLLRRTAEAFADPSHIEPTIAAVRDRAAQAGVTLSDEIVDLREPVPPEPPTLGAEPVGPHPAAADAEEPAPEPAPPPTVSPAWSLLRGETEVPEEARAAFVPEATQQAEPPKRRGLLGRLFGR